MITDLSSTECKCTPLQASFLEDLRKQLKVFKNLPDSDSFVKDAVCKYVEKFISAKSTSVEHLHEHLQQLYKREFLISDHDILDMAKEITVTLQRPVLHPAAPSASRRRTSSPLSPTTQRAMPLFSKPVVYHASVCCQAVNKCTHKDYSTFFKDEIGHSFKEVSISRSEEGRYLIAVEDSMYYIAFQGEPNIAQWPEKYKSLSEGTAFLFSVYCIVITDLTINICLFLVGISSQCKAFPTNFILELLRNEHSVVLTGEHYLS